MKAIIKSYFYLLIILIFHSCFFVNNLPSEKNTERAELISQIKMKDYYHNLNSQNKWCKIDTSGVYVMRDTTFIDEKKLDYDIESHIIKFNSDYTVQYSKYFIQNKYIKLTNDNVLQYLYSKKTELFECDDNLVNIFYFSATHSPMSTPNIKASQHNSKYYFVNDSTLAKVKRSGFNSNKEIYHLEKSITKNHINVLCSFCENNF